MHKHQRLLHLILLTLTFLFVMPVVFPDKAPNIFENLQKILFSSESEKRSEALLKEGLALEKQAEKLVFANKFPDALRTYENAHEKFESALKENPNSHEIAYKLAALLTDFARFKERQGNNEENELLYRQATEKFALALALKPNHFLSLANRGGALVELAKIKLAKGEYAASEAFSAEAESIFASATKKKKSEWVFDRWGFALITRAASALKQNDGEKSDALFRSATEKLMIARQVNSKFYQATLDLAFASLGRVPIKIDDEDFEEANFLLNQTEEWLKEALNAGMSSKTAHHLTDGIMLIRANIKEKQGEKKEAEMLYLSVQQGLEQNHIDQNTDELGLFLANALVMRGEFKYKEGEINAASSLFLKAAELYVGFYPIFASEISSKKEAPKKPTIANFAALLAWQGKVSVKQGFAHEGASLVMEAQKLLLLHADSKDRDILYNLAATYALQNNAEEALRWLREVHFPPTQKQIDQDSNFDLIRQNAAFMEWRSKLKPRFIVQK